ncbi:hypothetical protein [Marinicella rhabdoformis]|uniref:hypothetical protein n=1 Tax=Marinicella rhabdoformis TaxID=2580566 RepID=UPI0012AEC189|nr:hypothetical protein [Marinicella rhabdoformis]
MANICSIIKEKRTAGQTVCHVFHGSKVLARKLQLKRLGFNDIPDELWIEINRLDAKRLLTDCLAHDLAYQINIMPEQKAQELASAFLKCFDKDTAFLTNQTHNFDNIGKGFLSWEPITNATFDTGIIAVKEGVVGILWVKDED